MSDCAWFKACSDADLAESELRGEINRMLGRKEYQRQVEFGISIGGATHEQRSELPRPARREDDEPVERARTDGHSLT